MNATKMRKLFKGLDHKVFIKAAKLCFDSRHNQRQYMRCCCNNIGKATAFEFTKATKYIGAFVLFFHPKEKYYPAFWGSWDSDTNDYLSIELQAERRVMMMLLMAELCKQYNKR